MSAFVWGNITGFLLGLTAFYLVPKLRPAIKKLVTWAKGLRK